MLRAIAVALAFCALSGAREASAQQPGFWLRAESPTFIVYSTSSESRVRRVVEDLERFDALLRALTGAPAERSPTQLEIYLFNGPGQLQEAGGHRGTTVRGFYSARPDIIGAYAIYRDRGGGLEAQDVLFHEYAHHFMYHYFANVYPGWYIEGFAEFVATAAFEDDRLVLGRAAQSRATWLFRAAWLPFDRFLTRDLESGNDVASFYSMSWLFTHYLALDSTRREQMQNYFVALRLGGDPIEAFEPAFGMAPEQMESELRRYAREDPPALAYPITSFGSPPPIRITRLPRSADDLLPLSTRVRRGGLDDEDARGVLSRVRSMANPNRDSFALIERARAEATLGDVARARDILTAHVANNSTDAEAEYLLGYTYLREAREIDAEQADAKEELHSQARRHFVNAFRIDGNHVPTLYRYVETYAGVQMDAETADNVLNALLLARQLAPQVREITIDAADWLIAARRPAEAIPMLRMVAHDPHGGASAERARELLTRAEAEARGDAGEAQAE